MDARFDLALQCTQTANYQVEKEGRNIPKQYAPTYEILCIRLTDSRLYDVQNTVGKGVFGHMRTVKLQITLCIRAVLSESYTNRCLLNEILF